MFHLVSGANLQCTTVDGRARVQRGWEWEVTGWLDIACVAHPMDEHGLITREIPEAWMVVHVVS